MTGIIPTGAPRGVHLPRDAFAVVTQDDRGANAMVPTPKPDENPTPLGQRLLDRPFLLLAAGLVVMFGFYTLWGLYEILTLPKGALP